MGRLPPGRGPGGRPWPSIARGASGLLTSRCAGVHGQTPIVCATPTSRRRRGRAGVPRSMAAHAAIGSAPFPGSSSAWEGATALTAESAVARRAPGILRAMRLSTLFFTTLRDDPADAEMPSHRLLLRAGYVRQLGAGLYSLLPLGFRVTKRVEQVIREEMNAIGGQEMEMPVVHPAELWKDSGRYDKIGPELVRFKDRGDRDMVLAMTHEEVDRPPAARHRPELSSAPDRALPLPDEVPRRAPLAWRLDPCPRVRHEGRLQLRPRRRRARRELSASSTAPTSGSSSGSGSTRSPSVPTSGSWAGPGPTSSWSSTITARTPWSCATPADTPRTSRSAEVAKPSPEAEDALPDGGRRDPRRDDDRCPDSRSSGSRGARTAKAAFFVTGDGRFVVAIVRGDYDVNETKLVNAIKATGGLRPAQVEEIKARGMEPGYGSPIGATRRGRRRRRARPAVAEPRRRREPGRMARAQRQRPARLHARRHRGDHERPRGRRLRPTAGRR